MSDPPTQRLGSEHDSIIICINSSTVHHNCVQALFLMLYEMMVMPSIKAFTTFSVLSDNNTVIVVMICQRYIYGYVYGQFGSNVWYATTSLTPRFNQHSLQETFLENRITLKFFQINRFICMGKIFVRPSLCLCKI